MNTESYKALLALDRLALARPDDSGDLRMIRDAFMAQSEALRRANISKAHRAKGTVPPGRKVDTAAHQGTMVTGTVKEQAAAICSAHGSIDVYRFPSGVITWRQRGGPAPVGSEFIGTYDEGSNYRRVVEDLAYVA